MLNTNPKNRPSAEDLIYQFSDQPQKSIKSLPPSKILPFPSKPLEKHDTLDLPGSCKSQEEIKIQPKPYKLKSEKPKSKFLAPKDNSLMEIIPSPSLPRRKLELRKKQNLVASLAEKNKNTDNLLSSNMMCDARKISDAANSTKKSTFENSGSDSGIIEEYECLGLNENLLYF